MKKLFIIPLLFVSLYLSAAPIGEKRAREIATDFFKGASTRAVAPTLNLEWAGDEFDAKASTRASVNTEESLIYIYNRSDAAGYVVIAGDSNVERAVIAFSHEKRFDINNLPDGAKYLLSAWCRQIADARVKATPITSASTRTESEVIEVDYNSAEWNQSTPFNDEAPVVDGQRAVTGCVATAMSIICYHNKWPDCGVGTTSQYSYYDAAGHTHTIPENTLGRTYQYNRMRSDNYQNGYSAEEGAAVAVLMKDMGTSVKMSYHPEGSGAYSTDLLYAFSHYFKYSPKMQLLYRRNYGNDEWVAMLKANIKEYGPTYLSGASETGGHAFIADGYSTSGYFSMNFGWGGAANGFYLLPNIGYVYDLDALFYLEPDKSGTSSPKHYLELVPLSTSETSYRGLYGTTAEYATGVPFLMAIAGVYNIGTESFDGALRINLCDKSGKVKETLYECAVTIDPYTQEQMNWWYNTDIPQLTITKNIEYGDRLRIYAKDRNASEWSWIRYPYDDYANNEIVIKDLPDDIARGLVICYYKSYNVLLIKPNNPVVATIYDSTDKVVAKKELLSSEEGQIDLSACGSGECRIEFKRGGEPYVLTLVLK